MCGIKNSPIHQDGRLPLGFFVGSLFSSPHPQASLDACETTVLPKPVGDTAALSGALLMSNEKYPETVPAQVENFTWHFA